MLDQRDQRDQTRSRKTKERVLRQKSFWKKLDFPPNWLKIAPSRVYRIARDLFLFPSLFPFLFFFVSWFNTFPSFFTCPPVYDCDGGVGRLGVDRRCGGFE